MPEGLESVSWTRLTTFTGCSEKFRLAYVEKLRDRRAAKGWFIIGTAVHETAEYAEREGLQYDLEAATTDDGELRLAFVASLKEQVRAAGGPENVQWGGRSSEQWPDGENLDWAMAFGPAMVENYVHLRRQDAERGRIAVAVESALHPPIASGRRVDAYPDVVLTEPDGTIVVRDYKTGSGTSSPGQLDLYGWSIRELGLFGAGDGVPIRGEMAYLRPTKKEPRGRVVAYDMARIDLIPGLIALFEAAVGTGAYLPNPGAWCGGCDVRQFCTWGSADTDESKEGAA